MKGIIQTSDLSIFGNASGIKILLVSIVSSLFIIYPNITVFTLERNYLGEAKQNTHLLFFLFRYLYFAGLIWLNLRYNIRVFKSDSFARRLFHTILIVAVAFLIYMVISRNLNPKKEWLSGLVIFQFLVISIFCALTGHASHLYTGQRKKEHEIEQLKIENLQSRYDALTNQINPHFFFNSLNGLASLIRKRNDESTLLYVNKLSDFFRYILQSDKKVLVTLAEELEFVQAFRYMMEVRFANKLTFSIDVKPENETLKLPVLSLLPVLENITVHNIIDSDHLMEVRIRLENRELVVTSPVHPKPDMPETNKTGLKNLDARFHLLTGHHIRTENTGTHFIVFLPLKEE